MGECKRSEVFKRFDNGKYGLNEWYGIVPKKPKTAQPEEDGDDDEKTETATTKKAAAVSTDTAKGKSASKPNP